MASMQFKQRIKPIQLTQSNTQTPSRTKYREKIQCVVNENKKNTKESKLITSTWLNSNENLIDSVKSVSIGLENICHIRTSVVDSFPTDNAQSQSMPFESV